jgi:hypothetical protein
MNDDSYLITACKFELKPSKSVGYIKISCVKDSSAVDIKSYQPLAKDKSSVEQI